MMIHLHAHKLSSKVGFGGDTPGKNSADKFRWIVVYVVDSHDYFEQSVVGLVEEALVGRHGVAVLGCLDEQQVFLLLLSVQSLRRLQRRNYY